MVIDGEIRGEGNSRKIKSNDKLPPTYAEFRQMFIDIGIDIDLFINEIGWNILGSKLNKAFFLSDPTAAKYGLTGENATVNNALAAAATEVGDTLTTLRTSPGPQWALANGAIVDGSQYPEIAPLLSPRYMSPTQTWGVHPSSTTTNRVPYSDRRRYLKQVGTSVLLYTDNGWLYTANAFAATISWTTCVFPTANGFTPNNIIYANGMWVCAAHTMSGQSGTLTVWYCTGAPTTAAAWIQAYQVGFSATYVNGPYANMGGIAFNGTRWGVALGIYSHDGALRPSRKMFFAQTSGTSITTGWTASYGQEYYNVTYWPQFLEMDNTLVGKDGYFWYMGSYQDTTYRTSWRATSFPTLTAGPTIASSLMTSSPAWFVTDTGVIYSSPATATATSILYLNSITSSSFSTLSWSASTYAGAPMYTGVRWMLTATTPYTGNPVTLTPQLTPAGNFSSISQLRGLATIQSVHATASYYYPIAALEDPANPGKILLLMYMYSAGMGQWIYTMNVNDLTLPTISFPGVYTYVRIKP